MGVITNGTAVLGLGNIGPEAAKPVMEGKGVLFKKLADIDVFDLEIAETAVEPCECMPSGNQHGALRFGFKTHVYQRGCRAVNLQPGDELAAWREMKQRGAVLIP